MKIEAYGLKLIPLKKEDLDLVRYWRNSTAVKKNMLFKKHITKAMQQKWFATLDNTSMYLLICFKEEKIGVINIKNIDWENKTGETGIFLGHKDYLKTIVPITAIILFMDTLFDILCLESLHIKVLKSNEEGMQLNKSLGYSITEESSDCYYMKVSKEKYKLAVSRFRGLFEKIQDL